MPNAIAKQHARVRVSTVLMRCRTELTRGHRACRYDRAERARPRVSRRVTPESEPQLQQQRGRGIGCSFGSGEPSVRAERMAGTGNSRARSYSPDGGIVLCKRGSKTYRILSPFDRQANRYQPFFRARCMPGSRSERRPQEAPWMVIPDRRVVTTACMRSRRSDRDSALRTTRTSIARVHSPTQRRAREHVRRRQELRTSSARRESAGRCTGGSAGFVARRSAG